MIFGAGGHAITISEVIQANSDLKLVAFLETDEYFTGLRASTINEVPVLRESTFAMDVIRYAAIGVGQLTKSGVREAIYRRCQELGLRMPPIVSQSSSISSSSNIRDAAQLLHNVFCGPNVNVGVATILNNNSQVEHGSTVGNFCHISTGVILNGDVTVGDNVFVGSGSVVREGVTIPSNTVIPMGSVVTRDDW